MPLTVLSERDLETFHEKGFIVVPNAVPQENLDAAIAAVWQFLAMDPDDPSTWYPTHGRSSIVHLHQHQALWDNRQHPRVHQAFADLLGTEKLLVSMDRAGMKPPTDPRFPHHHDGGFVHWDLDTSQPLPARLGVQGVLALSDTTPEMGGFHCIPGFHRVLEAWISEQPEGRNPRIPDLTRLPPGYQVTPIPMKAGDLLIWNRLLAHGNGQNVDGGAASWPRIGLRRGSGSGRPRLAQYITMFPATGDESQRQERIACWRECRAPTHWEREIPEPYRGRERDSPPAELTPLGRRLLGLDLW